MIVEDSQMYWTQKITMLLMMQIQEKNEQNLIKNMRQISWLDIKIEYSSKYSVLINLCNPVLPLSLSEK